MIEPKIERYNKEPIYPHVISKLNGFPMIDEIILVNIAPYIMPNAFVWMTGRFFFWFLAERILPNEEEIAANKPMIKAREFSLAKLKVSNSDLNTSPIPIMPVSAPTIILDCIGLPKKIALLKIFQKTIVENMTATKPLVRWLSAK